MIALRGRDGADVLSRRVPVSRTQPSARRRGRELFPVGRGPGVTVHDDLVDDVAVERVLRGKHANGGVSAMTLTFAERWELFARLQARRWTPEFIAAWIGMPYDTVTQYQVWVETGVWPHRSGTAKAS